MKLTHLLSKTLLFVGFVLCFCSVKTFAQNVGDAYVDSKKIILEGSELHDKEQYDEAVEKYKQVHPSDSFYTNALYEMGYSYLRAKKYKEAIQACKEGLKNPKNLKLSFLSNLGHAWDDMGFPDSALRIYDNVLKEYPIQYKLNLEKGITYYKSKRHKEALDHFYKCIQFNPLWPNPHYKIGLLAAESDQPTLALMALQYYALMASNPKIRLETISLMEQLCKNEYTKKLDIPRSTFPVYDEIKEIDDIVNSKAALSKKYKSKVNLNFYYIKQIQIILERIPDKTFENDPLMSFYVQFFKKVWNENHFEGMILLSLSNLESKEIEAEIKRNRKDVDFFKGYAYDYLNGIRKTTTLIMDGKKLTTGIYFDDNDLVAALGEMDDKGTKKGFWYFFHDNGVKSAQGTFADDKKQGQWTYYNENGKIKNITNMKDGELDGEYMEFYDNGNLSEKTMYVNGKAQGKALGYFPNGNLRVSLSFENDKRNGPRIAYDKTGYKTAEYSEKDGNGEGPYKTFHANGAVNCTGTLIENLLNGPVKYTYENGKTSAQGAYIAGDADGTWTWYDEKGNITKEGSYKKGKETGLWKYYNANNKLSYEETYADGKLQGKAKKYDWNGILLAEYSYTKSGKWESYKYFDVDGKIISQEKTSGGKLYYRLFNNMRILIREGLQKDEKAEGPWKYYFPNGHLEKTVTFKNDKEEGLYTVYYKNGKVYGEYMNKDGQLQGFFKQFWKNGKLKTTGYYKDGSAIGEFKHYYPNGTLETSEFFIDDELVGLDQEWNYDGVKSNDAYRSMDCYEKVVIYDTLGQKMSTNTFNKCSGTYKYMSPNRKVTYQVDYVNGNFSGKATATYTSGKLNSVVNYTWGKQNGIYKSYYEDGTLSAIGKYSKGKKDSLWIYNEENGKPYKKCWFKEDDLNGEYVTYYDNGAKEHVRNYLDDERHGEAFFYNPTGTLMIKLNYQFGVLMSYSYLDKNNQLVANIPIPKETGTVTAYYPNGKKSVEFTLEKGFYQGKYLVYYETGNLLSETNYISHEEEGQMVEYYPNGKPKLKYNYFYGELQGPAIDYYETGAVKRNYTYLNGDKNGRCSDFDATGKVLKSGIYRYNYFIKP